MDSGEQPPKKRKLHESQPELPSSPPLLQLLPPLQTLAPQSLSHEEIMNKRRHRDEIQSVYDCYKQIKFYLSKNDSALTPELEQAYLSLITTSRGCTSVQRIVADLIPRGTNITVIRGICSAVFQATVYLASGFMHVWISYGRQAPNNNQTPRGAVMCLHVEKAVGTE
ncbi:hypothetical protein ACFX13_009267 [Malus domestica]